MSVRSTNGTLAATYAAQSEISMGGWVRIRVDTNNFATTFSFSNTTSDYVYAATNNDGTTMTGWLNGTGAAAISFGGRVFAVNTWAYVVIEGKSAVGGSLYSRSGGSVGVFTDTATISRLSVHSMPDFKLFNSAFGTEVWNGELANVIVYKKNQGTTFWQNQMGRRLPLETTNLIGRYSLLDVTSYLQNMVAGGPALTASGTAMTTSTSPPVAGM